MITAESHKKRLRIFFGGKLLFMKCIILYESCGRIRAHLCICCMSNHDEYRAQAGGGAYVAH